MAVRADETVFSTEVLLLTGEDGDGAVIDIAEGTSMK